MTLKPSGAQKEMVASLADRAERVRNRMVDSSVDNMLKITNDGRKLALDQRLMNDMLPDDENSKSSVCVEKAFEIWDNRLIALHHLYVPWRPSDIEHQEGRILRQGNTNPKVKIFRYVTEGTFDAYSWQLIENKQKFIGQIMTSKSPVRSCEDIDEAALTYAEVKALATGNPYIKEKMDLDIQVSKLKLMKANHTSQKYRLEDNIAKNYPQQISALKERIAGMKADIATYNANKPADKDIFTMTVAGKTYDDRKEAGTAIIGICKEMKQANVAVPIGEYLGL